MKDANPIIHELLKGLKFDASLKFHNKQFKAVLEAVTEKKFEDHIGKLNGVNPEEDGKKSEDGEGSKKDEEEGGDNDDPDKGDGSGSGNGDDDEDEEEEEDSYGGSEEEEEEEEEDTKKGQLDVKKLFQKLVPFFLFKWNGEMTLEPDLPDILNYCRKNKEESFLLMNYVDMIKTVMQIDLDKQFAESKKTKKAGTKQEVYRYLEKECGSEVEFCWYTSVFYITGKINTDDIGRVIKYLSNAKLI